MGSWFCNFQIRKNSTVTEDTVKNCIAERMTAMGYLPANTEESDGAVAVLTDPDSQWICVCSELLAHDDPASCSAIATPISAQLHTDVLGIACFDSDYLYLNLIHAEDKTDAWIGIGSGKDIGIERRTGIAAWKKKVVDYPLFSAAAKQEYVCAEEFLMQVGSCLGLSSELCMSSQTIVDGSDLRYRAQYLYFRMGENAESTAVPRLTLTKADAMMPCLADRKRVFQLLSVGAEAYGLTVYILGPGVEDDTLYITDVRLGRNGQCSPITLKKTQMPDGKWAYGYHDPEFPIPQGAPRRLSWKKQWPILWERRITLEFIPRGDARKTLDITVILIPDQAPQQQFRWNVWEPYGTKDAFIEQHNKHWKLVREFETNPDSCLPLLRRKDFD